MVRDRAALAESLERGHRLLDESESSEVHPDRATLALVKLYVGMSEARLLDHPLEAVRLLREAQATADESGYVALGLMAQAEVCIPSVATGRLDDTRVLAEHVVAEANAKGWSDLPGTAMASGYLGWLALWKGEPGRAVALLDRCGETLLPHDWGMLGLVHDRARAGLPERRGRGRCPARQRPGSRAGRPRSDAALVALPEHGHRRHDPRRAGSDRRGTPACRAAGRGAAVPPRHVLSSDHPAARRSAAAGPRGPGDGTDRPDVPARRRRGRCRSRAGPDEHGGAVGGPPRPGTCPRGRRDLRPVRTLPAGRLRDGAAPDRAPAHRDPARGDLCGPSSSDSRHPCR